jgi:PKD repeat protein
MSNGWLTGGALTVFTNKMGYGNDTRSFSPLAAGDIDLNISLVLTSPTFSGAAIDGIIHDNQYGNPVPSAAVNIYNISTSESYSTTTNIAGFYIINNLVVNRLYNITSTKTGYSQVSQPVQVVAVGV